MHANVSLCCKSKVAPSKIQFFQDRIFNGLGIKGQLKILLKQLPLGSECDYMQLLFMTYQFCDLVQFLLSVTTSPFLMYTMAMIALPMLT